MSTDNTPLDVPSLSVVIPAWNCAHIIKRVLDAIRLQEHIDFKFELIIVNDFSTDDTAEVLEAYAQQYPQLDLQLIHETTPGSAARSRNRGIQTARADLILFLDSDIVIEAYVLSTHRQMHQQLADPKVVVLGRVDTPIEWQKTPLLAVCNAAQTWDNLAADQHIHWSNFFTGHISAKTSFLKSVDGFDESYPRCEDTELGCRLHQQGMLLYYHPQARGYHHHQRTPQQEVRNNQVYGHMFAYLYRRGDPLMRTHIETTWFMEKNWKVPIKYFFGALIANRYILSNSLWLADKMEFKISSVSSAIWRLSFFYVGYKAFQYTLKQADNALDRPEYPEHI